MVMTRKMIPVAMIIMILVLLFKFIVKFIKRNFKMVKNMEYNICSPTFNGAVIHTHLSSVMKAVSQLDNVVNVRCGIPAVKYITPMTSNGRSAALNTGVIPILYHICVVRQPRSEIAKPE